MVESVIFKQFEGDKGDMNTFYSNQPDNHEALKAYADQGYTVDGYDADQQTYRLVQRDQLDFGYDYEEGIYYRVEAPYNPNQYLTSKLLVRFAPMDDLASPLAKNRMAGNSEFDSLMKSIAKNTYILRIADSNYISGTYYLPTADFPDYGDRVQDLIQRIATQYGIQHDHVLLAGTSRGGTGAIYHAVKGNYAAVALDPVVNREGWKYRIHDSQFIYDKLPENMASIISEGSQGQTAPITVISSSSLLTWRSFSALRIPHIQFIDLDFNMGDNPNVFFAHGEFVDRNVPHFLSEVNQYLYGIDEYVQTPLELTSQVAQMAIYPPLSSQYITSSTSELGIELYFEKAAPYNIWYPFTLKAPLQKDRQYRLKVRLSKPNIEFFLAHLGRHVQKTPVEVESLPDGSFVQTYTLNSEKNFHTLFISQMTFKYQERLTIYDVQIEEISNSVPIIAQALQNSPYQITRDVVSQTDLTAEGLNYYLAYQGNETRAVNYAQVVEQTDLVSFVLTSYNRVDYLKQMIESIFAHQHHNIELIIVDDNSTDGTDAYIQDLQTRHDNIKFFKTSGKQYAGKNKRRGFEEVTGDYVVFCDDDDYFINTLWLDRAISIMKQMPSLVSVWHNVFWQSEHNIKWHDENLTFSGFKAANELLENLQKPHILAAIYDVKKLRQAGFERMESMDDAQIPLRALLGGDVYGIQDVVAVYRRHEDAMYFHVPVSFAIENMTERLRVYNEMADKNTPERLDWLATQLINPIDYYGFSVTQKNSQTQPDFLSLRIWLSQNAPEAVQVKVFKALKRWEDKV